MFFNTIMKNGRIFMLRIWCDSEMKFLGLPMSVFLWFCLLRNILGKSIEKDRKVLGKLIMAVNDPNSGGRKNFWNNCFCQLFKDVEGTSASGLVIYFFDFWWIVRAFTFENTETKDEITVGAMVLELLQNWQFRCVKIKIPRQHHFLPFLAIYFK